MQLKWQVNIYHLPVFFLLCVLDLFARIAAYCSQKHEAPKAWILKCVCQRI